MYLTHKSYRLGERGDPPGCRVDCSLYATKKTPTSSRLKGVRGQPPQSLLSGAFTGFRARESSAGISGVFAIEKPLRNELRQFYASPFRFRVGASPSTRPPVRGCEAERKQRSGRHKGVAPTQNGGT